MTTIQVLTAALSCGFIAFLMWFFLAPHAKAEVHTHVDSPSGAAANIELTVHGMTCAACVNRVEKVVKRVPGVRSAEVSLASESASISLDPGTPLEPIVGAISRAGYEAKLRSDKALREQRNTRLKEAIAAKRRFLLSAVFTLPLLATSMHIPFIPALPEWLQLVLATPVVFYSGANFFVLGFKALRQREADMNLLIALGTGSAYLFSVVATVLAYRHIHLHVYYEVAASIITLVLLGRYLEAVSIGKTGDAIGKLFQLQPDVATVVKEGKHVEVKLSEIQIGDLLIAKPGARIAVDGVVEDGTSSVDESMLSGEGMPVDKVKGSTVFAGTLNGQGWLMFRAAGVGEQTALANIIRSVARAQSTKAPIQSLADKVTAIFVPVVSSIAIITFAAWFAFVPNGGLEKALINFVAVLIIACPCAMGLATPVAIVVGVGRAAQLGILPANATALQTLSNVSSVILDKTGTLTLGLPTVQEVLTLGMTEDDALRIAASIEVKSEHPLAQSVVRAARERNLTLADAKNFAAAVGLGASAQIEGKNALIGSEKLFEQQGISLDGLRTLAKEREAKGASPIFLALDQQPVAVFCVGDVPKAEASAAIRDLQQMGVDPWLVTGDSAEAATSIAKALGISDVKSRATPEQKLEFVESLQAAGETVAMVGDGINDAPALAKSNVGIAMGTGTDIAIESADITILRGDLSALTDSFALSRAIMKTIRQNLFFAFFYNVLAIPLAAFGFLSPIIGSAAMALSDVCVVGNALRLRGFRRR